MKTNTIKQILKSIILTGFASLSIIGCSKSASDRTPVITTTTMYTYQNGMCVATNTGQQVDQSYCNNMNNNMYSYRNGMCVMNSTGQQVDPSLCNTNTNSNNMYSYRNGMCVMTSTGHQVDPALCQQTGSGQQCVGQYWDGRQMGTCGVHLQGGVDCRGYTLWDSTGRQVTCQ